ncbi:MAG: ATP-binding protein [Actinomycetota bacterium]|nr:ATP-binding protein [Actinomycetota bacterium]
MQNNPDIKKFLAELNMSDVLNVEEDLGNGFVRLKISEAERRQALQDINCVEDIIVELLRNSRDAQAKNIFIATKKLGDSQRVIHFIDDGTGIPEKFQKIIFESRVTSKLDNAKKDAYGFHGRGMALFSIKLNVEDISITYSEHQRGTCFYVMVDLNDLPEKKDQSIMPQITETEEGLTVMGGVNNIIKAIMEFQLQNPEITIYYGTSTQILATMRSRESQYPKWAEWAELCNFLQSNTVKIHEIPLLADSYNVLEEISSRIFGMDISQRSIQRVIYGEIPPLEPVKNNYRGPVLEDKEKKERNLKLYDEIGLVNRFKPEEIKGIIKSVAKKIDSMGNKYFLSVQNVEYKKKNNRLNIDIELKQKD